MRESTSRASAHQQPDYHKSGSHYHRQSTSNLVDSQSQQLNDDVKNIPLFFYDCLEEWLTQQTFSHKDIQIELRLTFLQLIIVTLEIPEAFSRLEQVLIPYITSEVTRIHNYEFDKSSKISKLSFNILL